MYDVTTEKIHSAFYELLNEKNLDKITVKDIVERSNISRNTFYYHYKDITDLLETILIAQSKLVINAHLSQKMNLGESLFYGIKETLLTPKITYNIFNSRYRQQTIEYIKLISKETVIKYISLHSTQIQGKEKDVEILASFYSSALTGIIMDGLEDPDHINIEETINRLEYLLHGSIQTAIVRSATE